MGLALMCAAGCAAAPGTWDPAGEWPQGRPFARPADATLTLNADDPRSPGEYVLDLKTFETKTLNIEITTRRRGGIRFEIPFKDYPVVRNNGQVSNFRMVNSEPWTQDIRQVLIGSSVPGEQAIPVATNFRTESFWLRIRIWPGTPDELVRQAGFEAAVHPGEREKDLLARFPRPRFASQRFADGTRILEYDFPPDRLTYQVLVRDGKVAEIKRLFADQAEPSGTAR